MTSPKISGVAWIRVPMSSPMTWIWCWWTRSQSVIEALPPTTP
jgi:hypothetical protein